MNHTSRTLLTLPALLAAAPAFASSSIPQMNPASYPGQLAWLGISFVLLYAIVSLFIVPRVGGLLSTRKATIANAIATAEALKAVASATRGDFEAAGAEARSKAATLIAQAQAEAAAQAQAALAKLNTELETKAYRARERLAKASANAQMEIDDVAQSLAQSMTDKLLAPLPAAAAKPTKKAS